METGRYVHIHAVYVHVAILQCTWTRADVYVHAVYVHVPVHVYCSVHGHMQTCTCMYMQCILLVPPCIVLDEKL